MKKTGQLLGIDIFSGAGGLSLGAEMAGIDVKCAVEVWPSAVKTYKRNHPDSRVINEDIANVPPSQCLENENDHVFVVMGGCPCQGFSSCNQAKSQNGRTMDNPKNHLFEHFLRFVLELKPDWFLFENVPGLVNMEHGEVIKHIVNRFEELGYDVAEPTVLRADNYGVPQKRSRCFIIGNRVGIDFQFPAPVEAKITVNDAFEDLPELENGANIESLPYRLGLDKCSEYAKLMRKNSTACTQNVVRLCGPLVIERYKYVRQGHNWQDIPPEMMTNYTDTSRCHSCIYRRLKSDEPSIAIPNYTKINLIHPTQDRQLSIREAARLQSFPDDFVFEGPASHIDQQIGNAVPPLLAKAIFKQILSYYE